VNPPTGPDGDAAKAAGGAARAELAVLDLGVLEEMGIIPGSRPGSLPTEIITIFLREEQPRMRGLAALAAARKTPELAQAVHNLAGSSAILGARQVQETSIVLELAVRAEDWPKVAVLLPSLQEAWVRLEAVLAKYQGP
jgi:HPt (histidine-containing phosphotransfer) domain-containing protein